MHAQGVKQLFYPSVVIIVGTKIVRSQVLDICAGCKHNQSVDISVKTGFYVLLIAENGLLVLQTVHFLFRMPVVYPPHPLHWHVHMC